MYYVERNLYFVYVLEIHRK